MKSLSSVKTKSSTKGILGYLIVIPLAYEVCHGGIMFWSFLCVLVCVCVCVCVCVSVNNFGVRSITLKPLDIFS